MDLYFSRMTNCLCLLGPFAVLALKVPCPEIAPSVPGKLGDLVTLTLKLMGKRDPCDFGSWLNKVENLSKQIMK